ncbi:MAG: hypothetical protein FJ190_05730 [Gammaproteobacteria bacterium]|nr:hypothetical protein [Gammaproteobacteria bacterium]
MYNNRQYRNRFYLLLILALCVIPFISAFWLGGNDDFLNRIKGKTTNKGQLITPVITSERSDLVGMDRFSIDNINELTAHWVLLNIVPLTECATVCLDAIYKTKQLRLMLNKDLTRTRRAVVFMQDVNPQTAEQWLKDDKVLLKVKPSNSFSQKITELRHGAIPDGMLIIMDPLGNLMMQYEPGFDPYKVKKDLTHLLRISQIG